MKFLKKMADSFGIKHYLGEWDAEKNIPKLKTGEGQQGGYYRVSKPGKTNIQFITEWHVGDFILFDGIRWHRIPSNNRWRLEQILAHRNSK